MGALLRRLARCVARTSRPEPTGRVHRGWVLAVAAHGASLGFAACTLLSACLFEVVRERCALLLTEVLGLLGVAVLGGFVDAFGVGVYGPGWAAGVVAVTVEDREEPWCVMDYHEGDDVDEAMGVPGIEPVDGLLECFGWRRAVERFEPRRVVPGYPSLLEGVEVAVPLEPDVAELGVAVGFGAFPDDPDAARGWLAVCWAEGVVVADLEFLAACCWPADLGDGAAGYAVDDACGQDHRGICPRSLAETVA